MAVLSEKFQNAIEAAAKSRAEGKRSPRSLSFAIEGPRESGKSHLARQHIDALAKNGLIDPKDVAVYDYQDLAQPRFTLNFDTIDRAFGLEKSSVMIIDDIHPVQRPDSQSMELYLERKIIERISSGESIVVLVGSPEGMARFKRNSPLMNRLCDFITITPEAETALAHPTKTLQTLRFLKPPSAKT